MDTHLTRIVTFMAHPHLGNDPIELLLGGSKVITLSDKQRFFVIRKVYYDDDMKPAYTIPNINEKWYGSVQELKDDNPNIANVIFDSPILDRDNLLNEWKNESST